MTAVLTVPEWAVVRDEDFDYAVGRRLPWGRGGITDTSAPRPERFVWGRVLRVHVVGDDYAVVEYVPRRADNVRLKDYDPSPRFATFVRGASDGGRGWDTGRSWHSLDEALIAAVAWRAEHRTGGSSRAANSQAVRYVSQMLGL